MSQEAQGPTPNIVVFGQTGSGKSSLINMLAGGGVAEVSSLVWGCTTSAQSYDVTMKNKTYTFWDTSGLNEGKEGSVPAEQAIKDLFNLVKDINVNVIIYCVRGSRFTDIVRINFDLFCGIICEGRVPVLLVVTGLEQEEVMDEWWMRYKQDVKRLGLAFEGHACVTTIKGRNNIYQKEYQESTDKVWALVKAHCNAPPWKLSPEWLDKVPATIAKYMDEYNACSGRERKVLPRRPKPSTSTGLSIPKPDPRGSGSSHNIIVFGDASSGKSSIVNMIVGEDVAKVAKDGLRCTFQTDRYQALLGETSFSVYDTCGLNEGERDRALNWEAVGGLYTLLRQLDGVSLLIYCMRGKLTENSRGNWILFNRVICDEKVPIIAVVTGLEPEPAEALEGKAVEAKGHFEASGMRPKELCCIVSIRGKHNEFEDLYNRSQQKLRNIVAESCSRQKWNTGTEDWFGRIYQNVYTTGLWFLPKVQLQFIDAVGNVVDQFIKESNMEADEARRLKDTLLRAEKKFLKKTKGRTLLSIFSQHAR